MAGGLQNLSSVFQPVDNQQGVNYIEDVHATGFTVDIQPLATNFLGIEASVYEW